MTRDDVIRDTAKHIRSVGRLMVAVSAELSHRAVVHDQSKWSEEEWPAYEASTPKLAGLTYGSPEYKAACAELGPALAHHYCHNSHHPEYWEAPEGESKVSQMNLMDVIEMLCDWKAASERHADGSILRSIQINQGRFKIDDQLGRVMLNTARFFGWIP